MLVAANLGGVAARLSPLPPGGANSACASAAVSPVLVLAFARRCHFRRHYCSDCPSPRSPLPNRAMLPRAFLLSLLVAAISNVVVTRPPMASPAAAKSRAVTTLGGAPPSFSTVLPLGGADKINNVTTRSEAFWGQFRRFYHSEQHVFRLKRGTLSHMWYSVGHLGEPRASA